jgi:hypothetical protein
MLIKSHDGKKHFFYLFWDRIVHVPRGNYAIVLPMSQKMTIMMLNKK